MELTVEVTEENLDLLRATLISLDFPITVRIHPAEDAAENAKLYDRLTTVANELNDRNATK